MMRPLRRPIAEETPTKTKTHPAESLLLMKQEVEGLLEAQRVGKSTEQLQQVLMTIGEMKKVPMKLTKRMPNIPKLSFTVFALIAGKTFSKNNAEMKPARRPHAIAAPMLMQVPATGPQMIAPVIVPIRDPLIPILEFRLSKIEKAQLEITDALSAIKVEMKAYCQMNRRYASVDPTVYLVVQRVEVAQKARKRKNVPIWAVTVELLLLLNSGVRAVAGCLRKKLAISPQQAAKRQILLIWQSSQIRLSGESMARKAQRKQLRFQQKLNPKELIITWTGFILPNRAKAVTSCAIEFAKATLKLQRSKQMQVPPMLYCISLEGSLGVGVAPLKSVMKILNQNFWKMGETMIVKETVMILMYSAEKVARLKQDKRRPNPITTKIQASISRSPSTV